MNDEYDPSVDYSPARLPPEVRNDKNYLNRIENDESAMMNEDGSINIQILSSQDQGRPGQMRPLAGEHLQGLNG